METFENVAKKSRRKRIWKTVAISSVVSLVLLGLLGKGLAELTSGNGRDLQKQYEVMSEIAYPNVDYDSLYYNPTSYLSGTLRSDRFKDLDGVMVDYPAYEGNYSLTGSYKNPTSEATYSSTSGTYTRELRQKYPVFYNVNAKQTKSSDPAPQELVSVKEMPNQLVEIALTFDKPYTYKEIQQMIPSSRLTGTGLAVSQKMVKMVWHCAPILRRLTELIVRCLIPIRRTAKKRAKRLSKSNRLS